jgi:hypothetical protein
MNPRRLPPLSQVDSDAIAKRRRGRNLATFIALLLVAALFFAIAMVKLAGTTMP